MLVGNEIAQYKITHTTNIYNPLEPTAIRIKVTIIIITTIINL